MLALSAVITVADTETARADLMIGMQYETTGLALESAPAFLVGLIKLHQNFPLDGWAWSPAAAGLACGCAAAAVLAPARRIEGLAAYGGGCVAGVLCVQPLAGAFGVLLSAGAGAGLCFGAGVGCAGAGDGAGRCCGCGLCLGFGAFCGAGLVLFPAESSARI